MSSNHLRLRLSRNEETLSEITRELYSHIEQSGNYDDIETLLKIGADPNFSNDYDGSTALHLAVFQNRKDLISLLLKFGANPFRKKNNSQKPSDVAHDIGLTDIEIFLVDTIKNRLTELIAKGPGGIPNVEEIWNHLTYDDINPNIQDAYTGSTPLHVSAHIGSTKVAYMLLYGFHCRTDVRNDNGQTAVQVAKDCRNNDIAEIIEMVNKFV